jgi:predicted deacylase
VGALAVLPLQAQESGPLQKVVLDSGLPGPNVLVVAGLHGDEPSGIQAAKRLAAGPRPRKGVLWILPEANAEAIAAGRRAGVSGDLNRAFPAGNAQTRAIHAHALEADLVLDLHEAGAAWQEADVPTLVVSPAAAPFALDLLERLNRRRPAFTFTGGAPAGSLVGELGAVERKALVVEVPARLPARQRLALHRRVIEGALGLLGMR